uniref:Cytochrome P450 76A1-like n=2 Tax=Cicer arietinum TaxID=3827 RepID=A0A1S2Y0M3_CICAR|nr:cytochrome P450 76A1-like [Cicer arietinum]
MEYYGVVGLVLAGLAWMWLGNKRLKFGNKLPPAPTCWPIVGNILQLARLSSSPPHESFAILARKHGPIMTLWLGSMCTVVVSSSEVARQMFKNNDVVLAGRKVYEAMKGNYENGIIEGSLITSQYNSHWRMLKRLATHEFFVTSRLDAMRDVRAKCVDRMLNLIEHESVNSVGVGVDVGNFLFTMSFNLIGNLIFSKDLLGPGMEMERGGRFHYHTVKIMEYTGKPNVADYFPMLRWLDPQGLRRNTKFHVEEAFEIAGWFIKQRMKGSSDGNTKDFLDVLLQFRGDAATGPYHFTSKTINVVVLEMFTAGTDTTTSTIEWAMAELLHSPRTLKKVQMELRSKIGKIEENDIENLPYLKAVIKETLRLHPPLPFLVPHKAMDSCNIQEYYIPKETQILVNVWAIGRDPKVWDDPLLFLPERFMEPNMVDYKGQHFEFIPFGSGRRMCPAMPLVSRVLPMALGSLLKYFDWILPDGIKPEEMDMTEGTGITLRKAIPLKAIPVPYTGTPVPVADAGK